MTSNVVLNSSINSGWELYNGQRRSFEYTDGNITTIYLEKLVDNEWIKVFKQELTYDVSDNVITITGIKL